MALKSSNFDGVTLVNGAAKTFSQIYEEAKARIMARAIAHANRFPNSPYSGRNLIELEKAMRAEYERLGIDLGQEFRDTLPLVMRKFYDYAKATFADDSSNKIIGEIDKARIDYFLKDSFESVAGATQRMAVTHVRALRSISADVFRQTSITGETRKQVSKLMLDRALNVPGFQFIDNSGAKWQAQNYFEMLARTQLMNAGRQSSYDFCANNECDIVRVSISGNSCEKCAPFENTLLSITGATDGLTTIDEATAAGLFHPNCTHSVTPVPEELAKMDYNADGSPKDGVNS